MAEEEMTDKLVADKLVEDKSNIKYGRSLARKFYPKPKGSEEELLDLWNSVDGFMVVRHPFTRLVSAYEDKILDPNTILKFHREIQEYIKSTRKNKTSFKLQFPNYLLDDEKYQNYLKEGKTTLEVLEKQPSFKEFVEWIIVKADKKDTKMSDWKAFKPYYLKCPVCNIKFKFLKLDSELGQGYHIMVNIYNLKLLI